MRVKRRHLFGAAVWLACILAVVWLGTPPAVPEYDSMDVPADLAEAFGEERMRNQARSTWIDHNVVRQYGPDVYGGCYLDERGVLRVMLLASSTLRLRLNLAACGDGAVIQAAKYSKHQLSVWQDVLVRMLFEDQQPWIGAGLDIASNAVVIYSPQKAYMAQHVFAMIADPARGVMVPPDAVRIKTNYMDESPILLASKIDKSRLTAEGLLIAFVCAAAEKGRRMARRKAL